MTPERTVLLFAGTRPEAIKLAPVYLEMKKRGTLRPLLCATAQHRDLLDQVLQTFGITPDFDLNLMLHNQTLSQLTARLFEHVPGVLAESRPDAVVVQGDTTTAFAAAMCAFYARVPIAHVEAGLRTGDLSAPFPEEANRRLASVVTRWHFAPTDHARAALLAEGVPSGSIYVTGNTVIDALCAARDKAPPLWAAVTPAPGQKLILVTAHRRESFGEGMRSVAMALRLIAEKHNVLIVYPVHPNPNVTSPMHELLGSLKNVRLIEPVDYLRFLALMRDSHFIITDSGGVQEEAPALGKPVLVTRVSTERPEALAAGCAELVGTDCETIVSAARQLLADPRTYAKMSRVANPFGDGKASERICDVLERELMPAE